MIWSKARYNIHYLLIASIVSYNEIIEYAILSRIPCVIILVLFA